MTGVPPEVLKPINAWKDKSAFNETLEHLADLYTVSFPVCMPLSRLLFSAFGLLGKPVQSRCSAQL